MHDAFEKERARGGLVHDAFQAECRALKSPYEKNLLQQLKPGFQTTPLQTASLITKKQQKNEKKWF